MRIKAAPAAGPSRLKWKSTSTSLMAGTTLRTWRSRCGRYVIDHHGRHAPLAQQRTRSSRGGSSRGAGPFLVMYRSSPDRQWQTLGVEASLAAALWLCHLHALLGVN